MRKINLNDFVKVKFTEKGRDIYYHRFDNLTTTIPNKYLTPSYPEVDDEGYSEIQLWDFMSIFGQHMFNGCEQVIEDSAVYIRSKDIKED